jgi:hypothetical protein
MHPSSTLHPPFTIKKINFNQKSVSDVTSETHFCLKSIFLSKRSVQRGDEGRIFSISPMVKGEKASHKMGGL